MTFGSYLGPIEFESESFDVVCVVGNVCSHIRMITTKRLDARCMKDHQQCST